MVIFVAVLPIILYILLAGIIGGSVWAILGQLYQMVWLIAFGLIVWLAVSFMNYRKSKFKVYADSVKDVMLLKELRKKSGGRR